MLATEKEKLNAITFEIKKLGTDLLATNQEILNSLENRKTCDFDKIKIISKKERYRSIDKLDNLIINIFALYTPEARDLRELIAFLKITNEFDRIANNCTSFINIFPTVLDKEVDQEFILEYTIPLQRSSVNALTHAFKLFELSDKKEVEDHYKTVVIEESKNDDLYKIIEKSLLKKINNEIHLSKEYQDIMASLRRLEKIADRALSIANLMHYAKIGGEINKL